METECEALHPYRLCVQKAWWHWVRLSVAQFIAIQSVIILNVVLPNVAASFRDLLESSKLSFRRSPGIRGLSHKTFYIGNEYSSEMKVNHLHQWFFPALLANIRRRSQKHQLTIEVSICRLKKFYSTDPGVNAVSLFCYWRSDKLLMLALGTHSILVYGLWTRLNPQEVGHCGGLHYGGLRQVTFNSFYSHNIIQWASVFVTLSHF